MQVVVAGAEGGVAGRNDDRLEAGLHRRDQQDDEVVAGRGKGDGGEDDRLFRQLQPERPARRGLWIGKVVERQGEGSGALLTGRHDEIPEIARRGLGREAHLDLLAAFRRRQPTGTSQQPTERMNRFISYPRPLSAAICQVS